MSATPAIIALLATIALGIAVGLLYLQRARRAKLVKAHLVAALVAAALVSALVLTAPPRSGGPSGAVLLGLVLVALAAGWAAFRKVPSRNAAQAVLAAHALIGVASFLVLLAWIRGA
jgi:hypothetical protein